MKLRDVVSLYHGMSQLKSIQNTKIAYAVVKNEKTLRPIVFDNQPIATDEMKLYWKELGEAKTDDVKAEVSKKHADTIDKINKMQSEWEKKLDEVDVEVKLHEVSQDEYPENLTARQVELLEAFCGR